MKSKSNAIVKPGHQKGRDSMREYANKMFGTGGKETVEKKAGGKTHHEACHTGHKGHEGHGKRGKYGIGGAILGTLLSPLLHKIPYVGDSLSAAAPLAGGVLPFSKGGSARKSKADGGSMKKDMAYKAEGGNMRHGGRRARTRKADGGPMVEPDLIANAKQRWADNHPGGRMFAEGGEAPFDAMERKKGGRMSDKGRVEKAAGGVAKVRLGQSTPRGMPVPVKPARSK